MNTNVPESIKIYHITHINNLSAIITDGYLFSDAEIKRQKLTVGEAIGMDAIKTRRLEELTLKSRTGLYVGECVPFYFCPRSIMLYMMYMGNSPDIKYRGGQASIVHLVVDLHKTVTWTEKKRLRWAFTTSNAGARYFEDYADLRDLERIDWQAVQTNQWSDRDIKEKKQAEFLVERHFPWELVEKIGVYSFSQQEQVRRIIGLQANSPQIKIHPEWYY